MHRLLYQMSKLSFLVKAIIGIFAVIGFAVGYNKDLKALQETAASIRDWLHNKTYSGTPSDPVIPPNPPPKPYSIEFKEYQVSLGLRPFIYSGQINAQVTEVTGAAWQGWICKGDVILDVNGRPLGTADLENIETAFVKRIVIDGFIALKLKPVAQSDPSTETKTFDAKDYKNAKRPPRTC